jgi:membrane protein DedA with SNARE-associated domain
MQGTYPRVTATKQERESRLRIGLLALAGLRGALAAIAIPLAPVLYKEHFLALVLLRPTKDVLLAAGFLARRGEVNVLIVLVAAIPLAVGGVWLMFWLGRAWGPEILDGNLPRWAKRILPTDRIEQLCEVLEKRGDNVVIMGRLAAFPSTLMGAAAGASGMETKRFLRADAIGALLSIIEVLVAGYVLGSAYKAAGPWLTVVGVAMLLAGMYYVGRQLRRT